MADDSGRPSTEVLIHDSDDTDKELSKTLGEGKKAPMDKTKIIIIIALICVIVLGGIGLTLFFILKEDNSPDEENKEDPYDPEPFVPYNPIPEYEDLDFTEEAHRLLSREVATQTMVLATNYGELPLVETDLVVLFGSGTENTIYGGWGSGEVYNKGTSESLTPIKIIEGILNKVTKKKFLYKPNTYGYEIGIEGSNLTEAIVEELSQKTGEAKRSVAVLTISRRSGEGSDRPRDQSSTGTLLSDSEINTYKALIKYFDKVVLVLNVGSIIELQGLEKDAKTSILISYLPGMEAGNAIADVLVGDVNPSGHLTDTWAEKIDDYPTTKTFLEDKQFVKYKEGLFVGYRYFEEDRNTQAKVVFPFGHGLSYTTFTTKSSCKFIEDKNIFEITSEVNNTGKKPGKQVVQVYVKKQPNDKFVKVQRELVAFAKTKELKPNESQNLILQFDLDSLASYDETGATGNRACYVLEKGKYQIFVGNSVADTRNDNNLVFTYEQKELKVVQQLKNRVIPHDPDVANAMTKPNFTELFNYEKQEINNDKIEEGLNEKKFIGNKSNKLKENDDDKYNYNNLPTDKFNDINFKSVLEKRYTMEQLVDSISNEELAFLSYGKSCNIRAGTGVIGGLYNSGITGKYNIPGGDTLDGPAGLRQSEVYLGSTGWPCSTALASTFDIDLMKKVGEETGKEARRLGCSFWLAPGMNIHRSPLCGRNFEYYSEDPFLTGMMAASITQGLQSKRVSITLKHFSVNNKEENRNGDETSSLASDSRMAERVAREIYLKGFEIAVKKGEAWSIMSSYNRINGMKTAESYDLLTGILREEWGYKGLVMTDWGTKSHNDREAHAGNDVKMPGNDDGSNTILNGLIEGSVTRDELKRNILYVFNTLSKTAAIDKLFVQPKNIIHINDSYIKIKVFDNIYQKSGGVSYEACEDTDGGQNPTHTKSNSWITIYVESDKEQYRLVRIRYSGNTAGFGVSFHKYDEFLGEITNLEKTNGWQDWQTSSYTTVKFPKGKYELTLRFLGYDYASGEDTNKGNINYIEILEN